MKKHYDICIAGFWYGSNYGSLLNGYAMYRVLKDYGKEVLMLQKPGASKNDEEIKTGHNVEFVKKYYDKEDISPVLPYEKLEELNNICDCFCAGSDQIWNYDLSFHENLYLPFVKPEKKLISFSTSFGHKKDKVPDEARPRIREYFQRYNAISVREQFDVDILRDNYGVKSTLLFEPVFCIDKKYYDKLAENAKFQEKEPYLLTYILDPTPEKREAILYYGEKIGLKIVNILNGTKGVWKRNKDRLNLPNVVENVEAEDFLKAFMGASYVITDSFHGSAFSVIFNKPFLAIGNYGRGYERFIDLLGRLKLSDRLVSDPLNIPRDEKFLSSIDYTETNSIIEREANKTVKWVKNAVDTPIEKLPSVLLPKKSVTSLLDKSYCVGCGACVNICPTNALELKPDTYGYYRANILFDQCIDCGKCSNVCPALHTPDKKNLKKPECYEFIAKDENILLASSSGGAFALLSEKVFEKNGYVVGAAWDKDFSVKHSMIESSQDLPKLQKSKYVQSYIGNTLKKIKEKLDKRRFVLFTGCPCQVAGLKAYLNKEYENLITVDLLCSYSPSTEFFKKYLKEAFPSGLQQYQFRYKNRQYGWDCVTINANTVDGEDIIRHGGIQDDYQRAYHNHLMCPIHCENCKYQSAPRYGDLTIGDFWGIEKKDLQIDSSKGVSIILCNNQKGKDFLKSISPDRVSVIKEVPLNWIGGNGFVFGNKNYSAPARDLFYNAIQTMSFSEAVNFALKPNHGQYNDVYRETNSVLHYDTNALHFHFENDVWEEHFMEGVTVLRVKNGMSQVGKYATLPLNRILKKNKKYKFIIKFKINTQSKSLNFHIKDSGSGYYQIIFTHKIQESINIEEWITINKEFIPNSDIYDEFMIGASQVKGNGNYFAIKYINIFEY